MGCGGGSGKKGKIKQFKLFALVPLHVIFYCLDWLTACSSSRVWWARSTFFSSHVEILKKKYEHNNRKKSNRKKWWSWAHYQLNFFLSRWNLVTFNLILFHCVELNGSHGEQGEGESGEKVEKHKLPSFFSLLLPSSINISFKRNTMTMVEWRRKEKMKLFRISTTIKFQYTLSVSTGLLLSRSVWGSATICLIVSH